MARALAVAVVICLGLVACGGSKHESLSTDYVRKANAVCGEWTKALKDLGESPPLGDVNRIAVFTKDQIAIDESFTARFKAVPASRSEKPLVGPIHASFEAINDAEAGTLAAAEKGDRAGIQSFHQMAVDETIKVNKLLQKLDLSVCAS